MVSDSMVDISSLDPKEAYDTTLIAVSSREVEVLQLISQGYTVKEIAHNLYLSTHTIISHKKNLVDKLNARNSIDLIVKAIKLGVIHI